MWKDSVKNNRQNDAEKEIIKEQIIFDIQYNNVKDGNNAGDAIKEIR